MNLQEPLPIKTIYLTNKQLIIVLIWIFIIPCLVCFFAFISFYSFQEHRKLIAEKFGMFAFFYSIPTACVLIYVTFNRRAIYVIKSKQTGKLITTFTI